jgi:predicted alpha/beta-hydrolase family hydrolase
MMAARQTANEVNRMTEEFKIKIDEQASVTARLYPASKQSRLSVTLLLGHGAGANQTSGFMVLFAEGLAVRGIDVVTFNFLYTELGRGAPDRKDKLEACYRAAIATVKTHRKLKANRLMIGGKSMGGRIASQVAAQGVEGLAGLVFLGYPLHPPGKPEQLRIEHLPQVLAPMLFVQGARDPFGTTDELQPIIKQLKRRATLYAIEGGDHSFKVPKRGHPSQEQVYEAVQDEIVRWVQAQ